MLNRSSSSTDRNQLVFLVGHDAGGGYDIYTRTLARHIVKYIPGKPAAVVKTMPGAGGHLGKHQVGAAALDRTEAD
jgi:tripartite-type tricarboxylate transporter receptor subunit TctC